MEPIITETAYSLPYWVMWREKRSTDHWLNGSLNFGGYQIVGDTVVGLLFQPDNYKYRQYDIYLTRF